MSIFWAALLATGIGLWVFVSLVRCWVRIDRLWIGCFLAALPLSPVVNMFLKAPAVDHVRTAWNVSANPAMWPWWFGTFALVLVGVSEESIKLLVLSPSLVWRKVSAGSTAAALAFASGVGFGIGEAWWLALRIHSERLSVAMLPVYMLGGFIGERLLAMYLHSMFVFVALRGLLAGPRWFALAILVAMSLHSLFDIPPLLFKMKMITGDMAGLLLSAMVIPAAIVFLKHLRQLGTFHSMPPASGTVLYRRSVRK